MVSSFSRFVVSGRGGADVIHGGNAGDTITGSGGNDRLFGDDGDDIINGGANDDIIVGGGGNDTLTGGAGIDLFAFNSMSDGIDTITDFKVTGGSQDQISLLASMFEGFTGDDAFDLIGSGFLRAVSSGGSTQLQVDVDGGEDSFQTLAILNGSISNGILADHLVIHQDPIV